MSMLHIAKTGTAAGVTSEGGPAENRLARGQFSGTRVLDGTNVDTITAFLFHRGGHADPVRLQANAGKSFQGSIVLGMGFTFDDTDKKGVASPLAEMHRLIEANPTTAKPSSPTSAAKRSTPAPPTPTTATPLTSATTPSAAQIWVQLGCTRTSDSAAKWLREGIVPLDYPNPVAADWPELLTIVEARAKPERDVQNRKALRERWWQYAEKRPSLYSSLAGLDRVLAINCGATPHLALGFLTARTVFANTLDIFPYQTYAAFSVIQSRPHEIWARFFSSSMKDDLRYTPSDCFETFPFLAGWESHPTLEAVGQACYEHRATLMIRNDEGMTKTYNRFHDPYEEDPEIDRRSASCMPPWTVPSSTPTAGRISPPTANSSSTTRSTRLRGVGRRNPIAIAGRTPSATRCSPASSPSTPNAAPKKPATAPTSQATPSKATPASPPTLATPADRSTPPQPHGCRAQTPLAYPR